MTHNLINLAAFQVAWFCNVLAAAAGMPWLGPAVTAVWVVAHLAFMGPARAGEWRVLLFAAVLGYCADSMLVLAGMIVFPQHAQVGGPSPVWMVALWVGFAATLSRSLGWLRGRFVLAGILGALAGPLSYFAGARLGAIELAPGLQPVLWIGLEWGVALPLLVCVHGLLAHSASADGTRPFARGEAS